MREGLGTWVAEHTLNHLKVSSFAPKNKLMNRKTKRRENRGTANLQAKPQKLNPDCEKTKQLSFLFSTLII